MRVTIQKATVNAGISKKQDPKGRDFSISTITYLEPFEGFSWDNDNGSGSSRGYGLDTREMDLDPDALDKFADLPYPCEVILTTRTENRRNGVVAIAYDVKLAETAKHIKQAA